MKEKIHVVYIRSGREPYGVLVVRQDGSIGVSLCHKPMDAFNKVRGVQIAYGRARKGAKSLRAQVGHHQRARHIFLEADVLRLKYSLRGANSGFYNYEIETHEKT